MQETTLSKQDTQNLKYRALIIHPGGNTFINPSLKSIIDFLVNKGFEIDVRCAQGIYSEPEIEGVRFLYYGKTLRKLKTFLVDYFCSNLAITLVSIFEKIFLYSVYDFVIGVDRQGLIEASILSKIAGIPCIFLSFEIMFEDEVSRFYPKKYKHLERFSSKNISFWIAQDEVRATHLKSENWLDKSNQFILPLASAGSGVMTSKRLRDELGIARDKKVAIFMGSISTWSMTSEILESVIEWSQEWVLILHDKYGYNQAKFSQSFPKVRDLLGHKIFISSNPSKAVDDLGFVLSGISVGIAFYKPDFSSIYTGKNIKYLGLSSGKISTYLRYGIPAIVNDIGLYAEEIKANQLGFVVDSPAQIADCLDDPRIDIYARNAKSYFSKKLDFNLHQDFLWLKILDCICEKAKIGPK